METIGILSYNLEIPWGLYGDCSTTRRYPGYDMEIVVPLGDTLGII